jgi:hypothetical protein
VTSAEGGEAIEVRVWRLPLNPRIILCIYGENGQEHRMVVKVKTNGNFVPGMTLQAKRPGRGGDPWIYDGPLPRRKGQW